MSMWSLGPGLPMLWLLRRWQAQHAYLGSFQGDIAIGVDINVDMDMDSSEGVENCR